MQVKDALKLIGTKPTGLPAEIQSRVMKLRTISAAPSDELKHIPFETPEKQTQETSKQLQGINDVINRLGRTRYAVYRSNVENTLTIRLGETDVTKTVAEWIFQRELGISLRRQTLEKGLVDAQVDRGRTMEVIDPTTKETRKELVQSVRFYSQKDKDAALAGLLEEERAIEAALDNYNTSQVIPKEWLD